MEVRFLPNDHAYERMTTRELREAFVLERLFSPGGVSLVYCDADRSIVGGIVPTATPIGLEASRREMAADFFAERREIAVVNLGGGGTVRADGVTETLAKKDMMYIGRGVREIRFSSTDAAQPAMFYCVSYPAHATHATAVARHRDAAAAVLGSADGASRRTIYKYIHPDGVKSCQLVMGLTELDAGCVWNTMPPHTHMRRSEVYLYYDLGPDAAVIHLMGKPLETRSLVMRNGQAVISPGWSVHCGAGTTPYAFVWAMGGENQEFTDMDGVAVKDLS